MAAFTRFTDIRAWQAARRLAVRVYRLTDAGGFSRDPGLRDQMRSAARSAIANIAEGFSRATDRDFARFLDHARASISELQSDFHLASGIGYIDGPQRDLLVVEADHARALIAALAAHLRGRR